MIVKPEQPEVPEPELPTEAATITGVHAVFASPVHDAVVVQFNLSRPIDHELEKLSADAVVERGGPFAPDHMFLGDDFLSWPLPGDVQPGSVQTARYYAGQFLKVVFTTTSLYRQREVEVEKLVDQIDWNG